METVTEIKLISLSGPSLSTLANRHNREAFTFELNNHTTVKLAVKGFCVVGSDAMICGEVLTEIHKGRKFIGLYRENRRGQLFLIDE